MESIIGAYRSIAKPSEGLYKEKGSKFLAFAYTITSVEEAKQKVQELRDLHPKAVHVCFAWRIGTEQFEDRFSDDGEPNNSAGKPIFGQILALDLTNTMVAVVRYYGGTKLGVGGLITAYKTAAKDALDKAKIVNRHEVVKAAIIFDPAHTGNLMSTLNKYGVEIHEHGFEGQKHLVKVSMQKAKAKEIINIFAHSPYYTIEINT